MPPVIRAEDQSVLVASSEYPHAKWKFEKFNPVQSRCMDFYDKEVNGLIASSTSSGKTVIAEMFLAQEIRERGGKGMYLVPMRALAQEKIDEWTDPNYHFNDKKISICTGDYRLTKERSKELAAADLIIMTSEMLNHRSRNYKAEQNNWLKQVNTLIVDESHLLTVPGRGDHLEVGLMKFTEINKKARLVLLSATMPNVEEIADWISYSLTKRKTFMIKSKFRPVPLTIHYESYDDSAKRYDPIEEEKVNEALEIVKWYPDDKFLIFAHTKRTGELMKQSLRRAGIQAEFHNADLNKDARISLENKFRNEKFPRVIIATSTLAWGCYAKGTIVLMGNGNICKIEDVKLGDKVFSMSPNGFVAKSVLRTGVKHPRVAYEVTLESGENVTVSENHKFYATSGRSTPAYIQAGLLKKGDFLAVAPGILTEKVEPDDLGYLFGYFMGDGCKTRSGFFSDGNEKDVMDISFGKDELIHSEYVRNLFKILFNYELSAAKEDPNGVFHLTTKQREIVETFSFLKSGRHKSALSLFNLPRKDRSFLRGVLQGLFDSDGGFSFHNRENISFEFTTISRNLAQEVQQLLLVFGVRSTFGKKKMKDSVINGRLQVAKWIYRVRVYTKNIPFFLDNVGLRIQSKKDYGDYVLQNISNEKSEVDLIPARGLLKEHAELNNVSAYKMLKSVKGDYWACKNKQELNRKKCLQILQQYPVNSSFSELVNSNVRFSKISSIEEVASCEMFDIEVEDLNNYVGGGIISHNCNLPARRVIILGVNRGLSEVESHDIIQMVGRSGRLGIDPMGDAYILIPQSREMDYRQKLSKPARIESQLLEKLGDKYKILAFHLVSEIHHGYIKTTTDVHSWYKRSLAYFQNKTLEETVVDDTLELLKKCGAITDEVVVNEDEEKEWTVRPIGKVSSMFYFSPFDVSDLYFNFKDLFEQGKEDDEYCLSMALGNIDTQRLNIVSRIEKDEMSVYANQVRKMFVGKFMNDPAIKAGFCYFNLLNGINPQACAATQRNIQFDFNRLSQVLQALDSFAGQWDQIGFFKTLEGRIVNGVPAHLVDVCRIPNIGKARATKLYNAGFKTAEDVADADVGQIKKILNMKQEAIDEIMKHAQTIALT